MFRDRNAKLELRGEAKGLSGARVYLEKINIKRKCITHTRCEKCLACCFSLSGQIFEAHSAEEKKVKRCGELYWK